MIKKLIIKIIGSKIAKEWKLDQPEIVPAPGSVVESVPWYRSKSKMGFIVFIVASTLKYGPPAFGKPEINLPVEVIDFLQTLGLGVGGYGLRDALKGPEKAMTINDK